VIKTGEDKQDFNELPIAFTSLTMFLRFNFLVKFPTTGFNLRQRIGTEAKSRLKGMSASCRCGPVLIHFLFDEGNRQFSSPNEFIVPIFGNKKRQYNIFKTHWSHVSSQVGGEGQSSIMRSANVMLIRVNSFKAKDFEAPAIECAKFQTKRFDSLAHCPMSVKILQN
jgi:hypothetical protein